MRAVLEVRTDGRLRVLRMNRPERKNALDLSFSSIRCTVPSRDAATDDDVWAILLTGNGDAFCSGLDFGGDRGQQPRRRATKTGRRQDETAVYPPSPS